MGKQLIFVAMFSKGVTPWSEPSEPEGILVLNGIWRWQIPAKESEQHVATRNSKQSRGATCKRSKRTSFIFGPSNVFLYVIAHGGSLATFWLHIYAPAMYWLLFTFGPGNPVAQDLSLDGCRVIKWSPM